MQIRDLDKRHEVLWRKLAKGLRSATKIWNDKVKELKRNLALSGGIGLGISVGACLLVMAGPGVWGIALAITGLLAGGLAGVLIGRNSAKSEGARLSLPAFHKLYEREVSWIEKRTQALYRNQGLDRRLEELDQELKNLAENDPNIAFVTKEKAQLVALKKYLFNIREQANALKNWKPKPRCGWLVQQLDENFAPQPGSWQDRLLYLS